MKVMLTAIIALSAALVTANAYAQGVNLSGPWQCVALCAGPPGGFAYITQNGWDLNLVNEADTVKSLDRLSRPYLGPEGQRRRNLFA